MIDLEQISIRQRENFWFRERTENELRRHSDTEAERRLKGYV